MNQTLTLLWMTREGSEWLKKEVSVNPHWDKCYIRNEIYQWFKDTKDVAKLLVDGWRRNGEEGVELTPAGLCHSEPYGELCQISQEIIDELEESS